MKNMKNVKNIKNMKNAKNTKNNNVGYLDNFVSFNKFNEKWDIFFRFVLEYSNYYWGSSETILKFIKLIHGNKSICVALFLFLSWIWSNFILQIIYHFMMFDSIVLSLLVLQNSSVSTNSRRLCKNIVLLALTSLNIIGGMCTLLMVMFVYLEYSKFINRIIFKFLKFLLKLIGNVFPPIYLLYPDIRLFNFDNPDMTLVSNFNAGTQKKNYSVKPKKSNFKKLYFSTSTDTKPNTQYAHVYGSGYGSGSNSNYNYESDSDSDTDSDSDSDTWTETDSSSESDSDADTKSNSPTISKINNDVVNKKINDLKKMLKDNKKNKQRM